jgi:hypothetical protein
VLSWGSGSTPTLVGDHLIAITDTADEQINLLVYDRRALPKGQRLVCKVPLFDPGASANENSVLAAGRSLIVQNWFGGVEDYIDVKAEQLKPGVMRIDVREDESGCDVVWRSSELATRGSLKLSTATGLIYGSMRERSVADRKAYYAYALDFRTGKTVYRVRLGVGSQSDILDFPLYVGQDGALYQPLITGLAKFNDTPREADRLELTPVGCAVRHSRGSSGALSLLLSSMAVFGVTRRRRSVPLRSASGVLR